MTTQSKEQPTPKYMDAIFSRPPIFNNIFCHLSPRTLVRTACVCHIARGAVSHFSSRAWNIERHLSRFFADPRAFRSLQAHTGTLISGSNALQFLDRTFYPESDLDLYAHPVHTREVGQWLMNNEGYTFTPNSFQTEDFETAWWDRQQVVQAPVTEVDDFHAQQYRISGIRSVFSFTKKSEEGDLLMVQIISANNTPLECILQFHSTCVMNVIAFDAAYAFYPLATFEERQTVSLGVLSNKDAKALRKYARRGWRISSKIWPHELHTTKASFHVDKTRWVDDNYTWVVRLDTTGVEMRPPLSLSSESFVWDPVVHNSWRLIDVDNTMIMAFSLARTTILYYEYLVADEKFLEMLIDFFISQGTMEHLKLSGYPPSDRDPYWTWWDSALPGFKQAYLEKVNDNMEVD